MKIEFSEILLNKNVVRNKKLLYTIYCIQQFFDIQQRIILGGKYARGIKKIFLGYRI